MFHVLFLYILAVVGSLLIFCGGKREKTTRSEQKPAATNSKSVINTPKTATSKSVINNTQQSKSATNITQQSKSATNIAQPSKSSTKVARAPKSSGTVVQSKEKMTRSESTDKVNPENKETLDPKAAENETYYGLVTASFFPDKDGPDKVEVKRTKKTKTPSSMEK